MVYFFVHRINTDQLLDEISIAGLHAPTLIETVDTDVSIEFENELTETELQTLTSAVDSHVKNVSYVPKAQQTQIDQLIAYLNSANVTVANTARAVMIVNMAPRLPPDLLVTINASIAARLGG